MSTDIEIARTAKIQPIANIAEKTLGLPPDDLNYYGRYKAKVPLKFINPEKIKSGKLILVSAISPTPAGEGKTTTSVGLTEGLNLIGKKAIVVLREPSLGPVFGMKGGAAGGGYSQVIPMEDINLHFTGDFSAVEKAHNLLAALIDNNIQNKKFSLNLDPRTITFKRVMDMNDRALRDNIIGLGGTGNGVPRESGFDITAASEIMAILCLSNSLMHLKEKLGNIFIGFTYDRTPIYARDLKAQGAMAILLKDAIMPNLVQTMEGNPAIIHGGPFANIAQGTNTILATKMGLSLADWVVTEAGFGFDLGGEKFLDIKCGYGGLKPAAVVLVATVRALKYHGGVPVADLKTPNPAAVHKGFPNLEKHIENAALFGLTPIVALNHFAWDSDEEINAVKEKCAEMGVRFSICKHWAQGGKGAEELANLVVDAVENSPSSFKPLYDWALPVIEKIETIAKNIYGANGVEFGPKAHADLKKIEKLGLGHLPICIAKTQYSFTDDPTRVGRAKGFHLTIREIEVAAGAGFLVPIAGDMMRMPGLPAVPAAEGMDIDENGIIVGLS
jgi:formate--tetrahydrofolate ligase